MRLLLGSSAPVLTDAPSCACCFCNLTLERFGAQGLQKLCFRLNRLHPSHTTRLAFTTIQNFLQDFRFFFAVFRDSPFACEMTYLWRLPHKTPPWKSQKCFHETIMGFNQTQTNSQFSSSSSAVVSQNEEKYFYFLLALTLFRPELWSFWGGEGVHGMRKIFAKNWFTLCAALRNNRKLILMSGVNLFSFPKKVCGCSRRVVALLKFFASSRFDVCPKTEVAWLPIGIFSRARKHATCRFHTFHLHLNETTRASDFIMLSFSCFLSCTWHIVDAMLLLWMEKEGSRQGG